MLTEIKLPPLWSELQEDDVLESVLRVFLPEDDSSCPEECCSELDEDRW